MITSIVFDMDGVLADTEPLKFRAHRRALRAVGGELTEALYRREMGGVHEGVIRAFLEGSGIETSERAVADYEERFQAAYRELLASDLAPREGALEALDACRREDRPLALVTSSERWMAEIVLDTLGAAGVFRTVITADDVEREKPDPEPYRRAREALLAMGGSRPTVAVEDTRAGVASARTAGLPVVAVRHELNRTESFEEAAAVIESLAPAEEFLELADRIAGTSPAA